MRTLRLLPVLALPLVACGGSPAADASPQATPLAPSAAVTAPSGTGMTLTSADVPQGGTIALTHVDNAMGCTGQNISPAFSWTGAPAATRSFALTIHDPDAPVSGGFWHWVVYDIPASVTSLPRGAGTAGSAGMPAGARQGRNDFGDSAYDGPCPPKGDRPHHYDMVLSALDVASLDLPAGSSPAQVDFTRRTHTLASAQLTGLYGR